MSTFLEIMQAATRTEIHRIFFLWGLSLSHFQMCQKMVADGITFLLKHRANGPWNFTKRHHRCYDENVLKYLHRKLWKICRKTYLVQF